MPAKRKPTAGANAKTYPNPNTPPEVTSRPTKGSGKQTTVKRAQSPRGIKEQSPREAKGATQFPITEAVRQDNTEQNNYIGTPAFVRYRDQQTSPMTLYSESLDSEVSVLNSQYCENSHVSPEPKVYKDNALNRRLKRVGKPLGTAVHSPGAKSTHQKTYTDNALNRRLVRVGLPLGSMPVKKKTAITGYFTEIMHKVENMEPDELENFSVDYNCTASQIEDKEEGEGVPEDLMKQAYAQAICTRNQQEAELSWQRQHDTVRSRPKTLQTMLEDYEGKLVPFSDLRLHKCIGQGAFAEVYFAKWKESVVAVKKLKTSRLGDKRTQEFEKEIMNFCKLDHPNIVKFIGACTEVPNICIVMEYMQMSLYAAIHILNDVQFSDPCRTDIVKQMCEGVRYLHSSRIAHCDLKTLNVLLDYVEDSVCDVKITDFGLSMVKVNTIGAANDMEIRRNAGTPRYSAPEILRGEMLVAMEMMKADVYSLSLVIIEVLFEQEPFPTYNRQALRKHVGEQGDKPEIPALEINRRAMSILQRAWSFKASDRPDITELCDVFKPLRNVYEVEIPSNFEESLSNLELNDRNAK